MSLKIENISKSFWRKDVGEFYVLKDINLEIKDGEFICILGPTGCGKSTLLKIIAGLEKQDSGRILFDNHNEIAFVFQEPVLFPWLTVLENVEFALKAKRISKEQKHKISLDYLKRVHLGRFINAYPHELSTGMKQRVAIARALAIEAKILLMDEPFTFVDEQTRLLFHYELQEIWQETHKTIIFVTSSVEEATCLADRLYLFSSRPGRILKEYKIDYPRPRRDTDEFLVKLQNTILDILGCEIEKIVKEEIDIEYVLKKDGVLCPVDRNLGSNI